MNSFFNAKEFLTRSCHRFQLKDLLQLYDYYEAISINQHIQYINLFVAAFGIYLRSVITDNFSNIDIQNTLEMTPYVRLK